MNFLDDVERAIDDGVNVVKTLTKDGRLVPGAGSTEIDISLRLQDMASKTAGLSQYGIKKYGESFEAIPRILAENSGHEASRVLAKLYAAHETCQRSAGVDIENAGVPTTATIDAIEQGILDVYASKRCAIYLATDAALSVLRVDSIIMSKPAGGPKPKQPAGGPDADD